ncbi:acyltransferase [uncultured Chryseobacterium sp.]|uniref:acyltransferase family protein n=1 Tax=uncultured Chryseobacterium sp. TaxID=259322 RepID=UPI0026001D9A|nr:acyltransferase [uncultured Chryseobacterium sp.]
MKKILHLDIGQNRIFGLDLLRMLAILFVVFSHSAAILPSGIYSFFDLFYFDGVCIFFVLSGFLIGSIIIRSVEKNGFSRSELFVFWIRRWFRTLPNYYLFVIILAVLSKIFIAGFPLRTITPFLFFCQNIFTSNDSFFGESWSLSVEEWFYFSIPLFLFLLVRLFNIKFSRALLMVSVVLLLLSTYLRYHVYAHHTFLEMGDYRRVVIMRMDNLMYGVIGAYIAYYHQNFWAVIRHRAMIMGIALVLIWKYFIYQYPSIESFYYINIFYPLFCTAILCLLPVLSRYTLKNYGYWAKAVSYISLISYSLYLIHYSLVKKLFIDHIFYSFFEGEDLFSIIIKNLFYWCASLLGALLIYKYFEIPTMKLRDKIRLKNNAPHK